ncbi:MAG: hypothetical protein E6I43_12935, partial [Chloroflexi bacterium]
PNPALPCMGVDINRDYDFLWSSGIGTSSDSCSEVFKGAGAFSEPETRNVRSLLDSYSHIVSMMDIHSYSQLVLHPWGDDDNQSTDPSQNFLNPAYNGMRGIPGDTVYREYIPSDDLDWFASTGNKVRDAIAAVRGTTYTVEQAMRLYPTSATGHDYAYSRHFSDPTKRRIYGYTLETGLEFQPVYAEALNIISEVSSGVFQLCLSSLCVVESMLAGTTLAGDLEDMRALRREMEPSEVGRSYARLLDRHSDELLHLMAGDESLRARALRLLEDTYEVVKSRHQAQPLVFGPSLVRALEELLDDLAVAGSTELAAMAARLRPNLALFEGKTLTAGLTAARPVGARKPVLAPAPVRKSELAKEKPMPEQHERLIRIAVFAYTNKPLEGAHVTLSSSDPADRRAYTLSFDANLGVYVASGIPPARYLLRAEAQGLAPEQREVQVDPSGLEATVILGTPGLPFLYRGEVRVPFEPHADLVAVALDAKSAAGAAERVLRLARERGLDPVEVGEQVRRQNVHLFRFRQKPADPEVERLHEELRKVPGAVAVGSVVRLDKDSLSFLTNELVVKFKSHVVLEEVPSIAKQFQMATLRRLPQAGNAFLFRLPGATYARLEVAVRLVESGLVDYAEPNLISTVVDDVLNPTDFLFPMQWHLTLIHCPEAWRVINDNIAPELAFGSPNISIAVVDSGVDVGNPDFVGNVSNGNPKVYQVFDFQNMVANNNARSSGHGTCCAGIATALANNPAGVGGQNEGVAGSAGNCRLMAIERPFPGNEVAYSDMYVWTAGFDPGSSTSD